MSEKLIGSDIDKNIHKQLLQNFTNFIQSFSPLLDSAEQYQQNVLSLKLIENCEINNEKSEVLSELSNTLTEMIPLFIKFSILEDKLEKLHDF